MSKCRQKTGPFPAPGAQGSRLLGIGLAKGNYIAVVADMLLLWFPCNSTDLHVRWAVGRETCGIHKTLEDPIEPKLTPSKKQQLCSCFDMIPMEILQTMGTYGNLWSINHRQIENKSLMCAMNGTCTILCCAVQCIVFANAFLRYYTSLFRWTPHYTQAKPVATVDKRGEQHD